MRSLGYAVRALAVAVALGALVSACGSAGGRTSVDAAAAPSPSDLVGRPAPDFSLVDQFHRSRRLSDFRGEVVVLTFVSSRCTRICPLTAQLLTRTKDLLTERSGQLQLVALNANYIFNSVHDVLRWSKSHAMTHRWLFLTGPAPTLLSVYDEYGVTPGSAHTTVALVIDPGGVVRAVVPIATRQGIDAEAHVLARYVSSLEAT